MSGQKLAALKFFSLLFMLPGLAGLIVSASLSAHYLDVMPRSPVPTENRIIPREVHGVTFYQTPEEDRRLNFIEYSSVGIFGVGLVLGVLYLEMWGSSQSKSAEENSTAAGYQR